MRVPGEDTLLHRLTPLFVAAAAIIVFLPALKNGFVDWDDGANFVDNWNYRGLGPAQLKWMFTTFHLGPYQPLSWITYGLDYLIWGMDPFGYHLTNVLLHGVNAAVFCLICSKLLSLGAPPVNGTERSDLHLCAGFAALFFAVHPLRVESVAWITERRDVLSGLFYMLAVLCYIQPSGTAAGENMSFWRRHRFVLFSFLLALLSKGMAISLPLTLIVLDIYPLKRLPLAPGSWFSGGCRAVWLEKIPYFVLSAVFGMAGYIFQDKAGMLEPYTLAGLASRAAQVLFAVGFYIWKTLVPLNLAPFYKFTGVLTSWQPMVAGSAALAITIAAVFLRGSRPAVLMAWIYYLSALAPVSGIVKLGSQVAADRYSYLPGLGFAVLAGAGLLAGRRVSGGRFKNLFTAAAFLAVVYLSVLTWRQAKTWRDPETLWRHAVAVDPGLEVAHNNLAIFLLNQGRTEEAVKECLEALRINPRYAPSHSNLGRALHMQGKAEQAIAHYREALSIGSSYAEAYNNNIGGALLTLGRPEEAVKYFEEALRVKADYPDAHYNLGLALAARGRLEEALGHYREALRLRPDYFDAHYGLAIALAAAGRPGEAIAHYLEVIRLSPGYAPAYNNLSVILFNQGRLEEAVAYCREALRIKPDYADAGSNLSLFLKRQASPPK